MEESRKRKSTIPMGVFAPANDRSLDQPTEREEAVDHDCDGNASEVPGKRAVLDVSLDRNETEREMADLFAMEESDATLWGRDHSITDINIDKSVEELKLNEAHDPSSGLASATVLRDSQTSTDDGDPLEVVAERMDRFSVRVSEPSSDSRELDTDVDNGHDSQEKRHLTDSATDLGDAMKALFDNRIESEWEDFIRADQAADASDQREASDSIVDEEAVDVDHSEATLAPDPVQNPIDASAIDEPQIVVEPSDIETINSIAPLETNNAPQPGLPLIRGGVAGAATAVVLLAATTWAVIESRGNQSAIQQSEGSASTVKSMIQAEVVPSVSSRIPKPDSRFDRQSTRRDDATDFEQQTDQEKKPKAKRLSRRSKRAEKSSRRDETRIHTEPAPLTESASADKEPIDAVRDSISPQQPLPQTPSRDAIFATLTSLRSQVRRCVEQKLGVAQLDISIKGSGRVSHVVVNGDFRGTKQGSCIARIVRKARFEPFKQPEFRVLFPYSF